jgi:23S rRNA (cytosine1962-C5)-methyltransferase
VGVAPRLDALRTAIEDVFAPAGVILRNEAAVRDLEGLPRERRVWWGEVPDTVAIDESGVTFHVPLTGGQKTGHFFDQHDNKLWAAPRCVGRDVLDVYANTGGWALHALKAGARSATVVDSDAANMELAARNAASNGVDDKLTVIAAEGKRTLQELVARGARFGAVVLDPPAFAKQRKAANSALKGYREINALACMLLEEGGLLFTSTCSFHVEEDRFVEAVAEGARDASRRLVMLRRGGPSADHPVLPGVPETRYLKSFAFQAHLDA